LASERRSFKTIEDFVSNLHKGGAGLTDLNGTKIPTIYIDPLKYHEVVKNVYGRKVSVDTLLNIFHDERDVFVDVQMTFLDINTKMSFLLYANSLMEFFMSLSDAGIIAIAPEPNSTSNSSDVLMIQLPKREQAEKAYQIIRTNARNKAGLNYDPQKSL
jgi:hypothetical protein